MKKLNTKRFIERAVKVHGDKYDYSQTEYINSETKVKIICKTHGSFLQIPYSHLANTGCPQCGGTARLNNETFIKRAREVHGDIYNYSKVEYKNLSTKVCIICLKHGEFWQAPANHLNLRNGCPSCSGNLKYTTDDFIKRAREVHGDKYDYSKSEYKNNETSVVIICKEHGEFLQKPTSHINRSHGCPICGKSFKFTTDDFIKKAREIHGDKYDYSKVDYKNNASKVYIICPTHGEFWQKAGNHTTQGNDCPVCSKSKSKGEESIESILLNLNISFNRQHRFEDCKYKNTLPFDFYIPNLNMCIEYDGIQHFNPENKYYTKDIEIRDNIKTVYCEDNNIKLIRISYLDFDMIEEVLIKELKIEN